MRHQISLSLRERVGVRATVAIGFVFLAACAHSESTRAGSASPDAPAKYMPLAVGNHWTYAMNFLGQQRETRVEIVSASQNSFDVKDGSGVARRVTVDAYGVRDETTVPA